jgi:uncharacterized protein (TIGR02145 family)/uncharacterized repeat protein (TIGR02543 family)
MAIDPDIFILTMKETGATWKQQSSYLSRNDIKMLEELYGSNAAKRPQINFVKNENGKYFNYSKDNFSVEIKGKIIDSGESAILEKGVGLIKEGEKYIDYYLTEEGTDNFSVSINNLEPCTNYYFFVYATNSYGMRTSEYREFYASDFFIETIGIDSTTLGSNSVTLKGKAGNYCKNHAIAGFVFCDSRGENCGNIGIMDFIDTENYHKEINDLKPDSTYYFKAFINVKSKDYYGELKSFKTSEEQGGAGDWPRDTQTAVVDVTNPATGKTWMDRNLGASRAATSSTDAEAYGDLYQWGRAADGHEKRTSGITSTLSSSDTPGHGNFITAGSDSNYDWRSSQNANLWQGVNGINNPCPAGYRLPTKAELNAERASWSSNNATGAFASPLKLPVANRRYSLNGSLGTVGSSGRYWSGTGGGYGSWSLYFYSSSAGTDNAYRALGYSVRCLKDSESPAGYNLTIEVNPSGSGTFTGAGQYSADQQVSIGATSSKGWVFTGWTGDTDYVDDPSAANTTLTMPAHNIALTANFEEESTGDWPRDTQTAVVDVTNPATGKTWMDRNLGASRAAISSTDAEAYGDLYQWGRAADGHQKRNSATTSSLSSSDTPGHGNFILTFNRPYDWRSPQNNSLWQGANGKNNPCPEGYRLPTEAELNAERASWSSNNSAGAFGSPLKLPVAGYRYYRYGSLFNVGSNGRYWSYTVGGTLSRNLYFSSSNAVVGNYSRAVGLSVRCLKD